MKAKYSAANRTTTEANRELHNNQAMSFLHSTTTLGAIGQQSVNSEVQTTGEQLYIPVFVSPVLGVRFFSHAQSTITLENAEGIYFSKMRYDY